MCRSRKALDLNAIRQMVQYGNSLMESQLSNAAFATGPGDGSVVLAGLQAGRAEADCEARRSASAGVSIKRLSTSFACESAFLAAPSKDLRLVTAGYKREEEERNVEEKGGQEGQAGQKCKGQG